MSTTTATENPVGSVARAFPRAVDRGFPRWLRGVDLVHLTSPHPVTLAADAVVVWLGLQIAGVEGARAPIIVAAVVVVCLVGGVYTGRDTVETQGVLWYPARLAAPLMVVALASILITGDRSSASMVPPLAELFLSPSRPAQVGGLPLISLGMIGRPRRSQPGKRLVDAVLASVVLLLAAPVMLVVSLAVLLDGGRPILFRQRRVGR